MIRIVNESSFPTNELKRLTRIAVRRLKRSFVLKPITSIIVQSYNSKSWEGHYNGRDQIVLRIGNKVRFPNTWDRITELVTWEDLYVALLTWCIMLHYQKQVWLKTRSFSQKMKYSRRDCQEITVRAIQRWRVESEMKMIFEKAGYAY